MDLKLSAYINLLLNDKGLVDVKGLDPTAKKIGSLILNRAVDAISFSVLYGNEDIYLKFAETIKNQGLGIAYLYNDVASLNSRMDYCLLASENKKVRQAKIEEIKGAIDIAAHISAEAVLLSYEDEQESYPFKEKPGGGFENLILSLDEISRHNLKVKVAIIPSNQFSIWSGYPNNTGRLMMVLGEIGRKNLGGVIDTGNTSMFHGQLAEDSSLLSMHEKLFAICLNKNNKNWYHNLLPGSISFWEFLEFFYYLNRTGFNSYIDICSSDKKIKYNKIVKSAIQSEEFPDDIEIISFISKIVKDFKKLADILNLKNNEIENNLHNYQFADNVDLISGLIFK